MLNHISTMFCHVDMDAFYASAEMLRHPELKDRPVVVGGGAGKRLGVVAASSYKAREYGIKSGTPISKARGMCSDLVIIHPDFKYYDDLSARVMSIIADVSPDVQVLSIDEALVEITGVLRLWGSPMKAGALIREQVKEKTGLSCTVGISRFPVLAKMASKLAKPDGLLVIMPGYETNFLLDHNISLIPGVGKSTSRYYRYHQINTIGDMVCRLPVKWDQMMLTRVQTQRFPKSVSSSITLDSDCDKRDEALKVLEMLCNKCGTKMRRHRVRASNIAVIIRYSDFQTFVLGEKAEKLVFDSDIKRIAFALFRKADILPLDIRLLGVRLYNFDRYEGDLPVFGDKAVVKKTRVYHVMDRIRKKYSHIESIVHGKK